MLWYDLTSTVGDDNEYAKQYGESKLMSEFLEYESITGVDWVDSFMGFSNGNPQGESRYSMEQFHKEVVLKHLESLGEVKSRAS